MICIKDWVELIIVLSLSFVPVAFAQTTTSAAHSASQAGAVRHPEMRLVQVRLKRTHPLPAGPARLLSAKPTIPPPIQTPARPISITPERKPSMTCRRRHRLSKHRRRLAWSDRWNHFAGGIRWRRRRRLYLANLRDFGTCPHDLEHGPAQRCVSDDVPICRLSKCPRDRGSTLPEPAGDPPPAVTTTSAQVTEKAPAKAPALQQVTMVVDPPQADPPPSALAQFCASLNPHNSADAPYLATECAH